MVSNGAKWILSTHCTSGSETKWNRAPLAVGREETSLLGGQEGLLLAHLRRFSGETAGPPVFAWKMMQQTNLWLVCEGSKSKGAKVQHAYK